MAAPPLIGLCGLAGSGKSTAAQFLERRGFARLAFAGPLKDMARAFGLSDREISGDLKEVPQLDLCGKTPRQFMQRLGTEFGRQLIGEDIWLRAFRRRLVQIQGAAGVVVDDVRFANEAQLLRSLGGVLVCIERPGAGSASGGGHISEAGIPGIEQVILNAGSVFDLQAMVLSLLEALPQFQATLSAFRQAS